MKMNRKLVIYFFVLLVFFIYQVSANYIFNVLFRTAEESKLVDITLPLETQRVTFNIEKIKEVDLKWKKGLFIQGWVLKTIEPKKNREAFLVLRSEHSTLVFNVLNDSIPRPDLIEHFQFDDNQINKGFETIIPLYLLKDDSYKIGFVLLDESGNYYSVSNIELKKTNGDFIVVDLSDQPESTEAEPGPDPESLSHQVTLSIQRPTKEINYNFDSVYKSRNQLTIKGWGFLDGLDTKSLKSFLLLKKNKDVLIFDVIPVLRKDVTSHFKKAKLNLDSTGFQAVIPTGNLGKGTYQLGLYLSKGNQIGIVYSDKFIEIGN